MTERNAKDAAKLKLARQLYMELAEMLIKAPEKAIHDIGLTESEIKLLKEALGLLEDKIQFG